MSVEETKRDFNGDDDNDDDDNETTVRNLSRTNNLIALTSS
jgi:hypothetical protein